MSDGRLNEQTQDREKTITRKIARGLKAYLTDWRNLLAHGMLGVVLLIVAIWAPVVVWIKLIVIACLICFNTWRMRRKNKH